MSVKLNVALAASVLCLVSAVRGEDPPAAIDPQAFMKAMAEAGKPGAEHAKLDPLVGKWTYTGKFWMAPDQPPMETKGTIERKWILGGRFVEEKIAGEGFPGQPGFEGLGLLGYDNAKQQFTYSFHCNMGTGCSTGVGVADEGGKSLTFKTEVFCPVFKKTMHGRDEIRMEGSDKIVITSYMNEGGQEMKMMELTTTRTK